MMGNMVFPCPSGLFHMADFFLGLIRWGIVIHGFIDGYSRLITGLRASNNNSTDTVFNLFMCAAEIYGVPSWMRGDHGTENLIVALFMEHMRGIRRGSYIWGQYGQFTSPESLLMSIQGVCTMYVLNGYGSMSQHRLEQLGLGISPLWNYVMGSTSTTSTISGYCISSS